jgi:hypothetical protein
MDTSFSSTGSNSALHQDALRVNRFLSRNQKKTTSRVPSPVLGLDALLACGSSESLQYVSFEKPREQKTYVIEGIHGPVPTEKVPIRVSKKRDHGRTRQRFKQYVAAKQSERARKNLGMHHLPIPSQDEYDVLYPRQNESPTTVTADISNIRYYSDHELDDAFIYFKSPLKSNFNRNIGMVPKKKLTWWDDDENRHKPFLLRSDDLWDDCSDEESYKGRAVLFGNSSCPHDNLKDLIEDYSDRLRSVVTNLFQVKRIGNNSAFRDNFASFSEDLNEDYDNRGGCAGPSRQLIKVVQNVLPPVCDFETFDGHEN